MPLYNYLCNQCDNEFEELSPYDETGEYPNVACPRCGSTDKEKVPSTFAFNFTNPEGTDRWNSGNSGHDYRFKTKTPQVQAERALAEAASHMGANPYNIKNDIDKYDTGVHDV